MKKARRVALNMSKRIFRNFAAHPQSNGTSGFLAHPANHFTAPPFLGVTLAIRAVPPKSISLVRQEIHPHLRMTQRGYAVSSALCCPSSTFASLLLFDRRRHYRAAHFRNGDQKVRFRDRPIWFCRVRVRLWQDRNQET